MILPQQKCEGSRMCYLKICRCGMWNWGQWRPRNSGKAFFFNSSIKSLKEGTIPGRELLPEINFSSQRGMCMAGQAFVNQIYIYTFFPLIFLWTPFIPFEASDPYPLLSSRWYLRQLPGFVWLSYFCILVYIIKFVSLLLIILLCGVLGQEPRNSYNFYSPVSLPVPYDYQWIILAPSMVFDIIIQYIFWIMEYPLPR